MKKIIKSITIKNFRQYKNLSLDFTNKKDNDYNLYILIAKNGVGKSNLLNAITWCFYGEELHLQDKNRTLPIVNLVALSEMTVGDEVEVEVEIIAEINKKENKFKRTISYKKTGTSKTDILSGFTKFVVTREEYDSLAGYTREMDLDDEMGQTVINQNFPQSINQYFFFDAEQMENYFNANDNHAIISAINEISSINDIKNLREKLDNIYGDYNRELSKNVPNLNFLYKDVEKQKQICSEAEKNYNDINNEILKSENEKIQLTKEIKNVENLKEVTKLLETLNERLKDQKVSLNNANIKIQKFIFRYTILINMYPKLVKAKNLIKKKRDNNTLPPKVSVELLNDIVKDHACSVCGSHIDDEGLNRIKEIIDRIDMSTPVSNLLLKNENQINDLINEVFLFHNIESKLLKDKALIESKINEIENNISTNKRSIEDIDNKDSILNKINKLEAVENALRIYYGKKTSAKANYDNSIVNLKYVNNKYQNAVDKNNNSLKLKNYAKFTKVLIDDIQLIEDKTVGDIRTEIEKVTFDNFKKSIWKKNTYARVKITKDYTVDLIHVDGYSAIGSTSAAERALLALSFTNAINQVSKFNNPLVIDSPVGRISDMNRSLFAQTIAEISKEKQIIMFFTPDEYSKEISDVFDYIATKNRAKMCDSEKMTTIMEVL